MVKPLKCWCGNEPSFAPWDQRMYGCFNHPINHKKIDHTSVCIYADRNWYTEEDVIKAWNKKVINHIDNEYKNNMQCPKCGKHCKPNWVYCPFCAEQVGEVGAINPKRNAAIVEEYKAGKSYADIGRDYGITRARVMQIVARSMKREMDCETEPVLKLLYSVSDDERLVTLTYNLLARYQYNTTERVASMDLEMFAKFHGVGEKVIGLLEKVQDEMRA